MELNNREDVEGAIAAMLLAQNEAQRSAIEDAIGWPPKKSAVPNGVLHKLQRDSENELYGILGSLFVMSATQLGDRLDFKPYRPTVIDDAHRWARSQARLVSTGTLATKYKKVVRAVEAARSGGTSPLSDLPSSPPLSNHLGWRIPDEALSSVEEAITSAFNEAAAKTVAKTEVTQAQTAGEKSTAKQFQQQTGKVLEAFWRHKNPKGGTHPCQICAKLENTPSFRWPEIYPTKPHLWNGPPAHPNCDCDLEWVELTLAQASGYGMNLGG